MEEITTKEAFVKEMQAQLVEMAEEQKEDKVAAYDILKVCQEVNEENIGESKIWETLSGNAEVRIKQPEPKKELPAEVSQEMQLISLEPAKRTIFDRLRDRFGKKDGSTVYTFGKFNEKTGQYENIRVEEHCFPPVGKHFIKRCQRECIGLDINDRHVVDMVSVNANMPNLQSLSFGKDVWDILCTRKDLEEFLPNLKRVEFSDDVKRLGECLFEDCENLTDVKFGENIEDIGNYCFCNCGLETITIPNKVSKIRSSAFSYCSKLRSVNLPKNLSEIEDSAFCGCKNLENIDLSSADKLSEIGIRSFLGCSKLKDVSFPENLTELGDYAFFSLTNSIDSVIHIPKSVKYLNGDAFNKRRIFGNQWKYF